MADSTQTETEERELPDLNTVQQARILLGTTVNFLLELGVTAKADIQIVELRVADPAIIAEKLKAVTMALSYMAHKHGLTTDSLKQSFESGEAKTDGETV